MKQPPVQEYGGWKFVYFWKRKWHARKFQQNDSFGSIVEDQIQKTVSTPTTSLPMTNVNEIKPQLLKELHSFIKLFAKLNQNLAIFRSLRGEFAHGLHNASDEPSHPFSFLF
eukprot:Phypoly_transcript_14763.p1 GENE.Phypoly_transcript_14763~~Phypoly_transcript_14763.p1  ORF type:complete len:127 (+),score=20.90 Phypoly_transcript_14763:48-383(+)